MAANSARRKVFVLGRQQSRPGGCGTVFSLTPAASPGGAWTHSVLLQLPGPPSRRKDLLMELGPHLRAGAEHQQARTCGWPGFVTDNIAGSLSDAGQEEKAR